LLLIAPYDFAIAKTSLRTVKSGSSTISSPQMAANNRKTNERKPACRHEYWQY
jgi:hypothetical protein